LAHIAAPGVLQTLAWCPSQHAGALRGTMSSPAALSGLVGRRGWPLLRPAAQARFAGSFQQLAFNFPSPCEKIADANPAAGRRKTEIICTIGPKCWDPEVLVKLIDAGMDTMRFNMSHGDHAEQTMKIENLMKAYELRPEARGRIKYLMDTRGPEIRTGYFEVYNSKKVLKAGQPFKLVCGNYDFKGDEHGVAVTYAQLPRDVVVGQIILVQDGSVVLEVTEVGEDFVMTRVQNNGRLGEKKNVNVPGVKIDLPVVGEREIKDIVEWSIPHKCHYIALSFVQSAQDVRDCRKHCLPETQIIAKIENVEGIKNFDEILAESDGIMVARGDLGMEIPMEKIWMAQKFMVQKTREAGKIIVCATEMLASMEDKPFPTRAEACDVANAVLDGCNMVMLSAEVATGAFPAETLTMMRRIVEETERAME